MNHTILYWIPIALYGAGWLGQTLRYWSGKGERIGISGALLGVGWGGHGFLLLFLLYLGDISVETLLAAASWLAMGLYFFVMLKLPRAVIPYIVPPFAMALMITASVDSGRSSGLEQGLGLSVQWARNLLTAHIIAVVGGTVLFGLACLASVFYLYQERQLKSKLSIADMARIPSLGALAAYNHRAITLGFFGMTIGLLLGLLLGGISTLPLRVFSLRQALPTANWLVYALFLVAHDLQGWRGRFGAIWSILGFVAVVLSLGYEIYFLRM